MTEDLSFQGDHLLQERHSRGHRQSMIRQSPVGRLMTTLGLNPTHRQFQLHGHLSATAVAATDATIVPVGEKQFLFLVSRTPFFALNVMRVLADRLRSANKIAY